MATDDLLLRDLVGGLSAPGGAGSCRSGIWAARRTRPQPPAHCLRAAWAVIRPTRGARGCPLLASAGARDPHATPPAGPERRCHKGFQVAAQFTSIGGDGRRAVTVEGPLPAEPVRPPGADLLAHLDTARGWSSDRPDPRGEHGVCQRGPAELRATQPDLRPHAADRARHRCPRDREAAACSGWRGCWRPRQCRVVATNGECRDLQPGTARRPCGAGRPSPPPRARRRRRFCPPHAPGPRRRGGRPAGHRRHRWCAWTTRWTSWSPTAGRGAARSAPAT